MLTKEIESWRGFADQLPEKEKQVMKMLNDCYKYSTAINAKGRPFPSEGVIMSLLLSQHKLTVAIYIDSGEKNFETLKMGMIRPAPVASRLKNTHSSISFRGEVLILFRVFSSNSSSSRCLSSSSLSASSICSFSTPSNLAEFSQI